MQTDKQVHVYVSRAWMYVSMYACSYMQLRVCASLHVLSQCFLQCTSVYLVNAALVLITMLTTACFLRVWHTINSC